MAPLSLVAKRGLIVSSNLFLVVGVTSLVIAELTPLAFALVMISKWQILLGGWRSWLINLRSNACDLVVNLSFVVLISMPPPLWIKLILAGLYLLWLVVIKPQSNHIWIGVQAGVCQFLGLTVLFLCGRYLPGIVVVAAAWALGLISARHFLSGEDEPAKPILIGVWALLLTELSWLLWRWLITYTVFGGYLLLPQIALIATIIGYCFARIYFDHVKKRLNRRRLSEYVLVCLVVLVIVIAGTQWDVRL